MSTFALPPRAPRKIVESDILKECIDEITRMRGVRATRNNVGTLKDERGIPITFGLGEGSPDIVGLITFGGVESTVDAIRPFASIAVAFGLEVKQPGRYMTRSQKAWRAVATRRGMRVALVRSREEARDAVLAFRDEYARAIRELGRAWP